MESEGIARNIFNIIDAAYYLGKDAEPMLHSDARGKKYAKAYGPNKELLDTGWSTKNAWVGLHNLSVRFYTDTVATNGAVLEYHWKDAEGSTGSYSVNLLSQADIADEFGRGAGNAYFHENLEYKFIVKSHPDIAEDEYVAVDYIKMELSDIRKVTSQYTYAGSGGEVPAIQVLRAGTAVVTGDGSDYAYGVTIDLGATPQLYYATATAVTNLKSYYGMIDSKGASSFVAWAVNKDGSVWSGGVSINWTAVCWEEVISLK